MSRKIALRLFLLAFAAFPRPTPGAEFPRFEAKEIDPHVGKVCYAVTTADVERRRQARRRGRGRGRGRLVREPVLGQSTTIIKDATERDNVCIQPHDIDGDGRVDFALGAAGSRRTRRPAARSSGSGRRTSDEAWQRHPDRRRSRPLHRMRWGDVRARARSSSSSRRSRGEGRRGRTGGRAGGAGPGLTIPERPGRRPLAGRGRRRAPCTRPTTSSRSTSTATARTRSSSPPGKACSCSSATRRRALVEDADRRGQPGDHAEQGVERGQGRPARRRRPIHRHDRALARVPGRRLHAAEVGGSGLWDRQVIDEPVAMGPRRLVRRPRRRRRRRN